MPKKKKEVFILLDIRTYTYLLNMILLSPDLILGRKWETVDFF